MKTELKLIVTNDQAETAKDVLSKLAQEFPLHFYFWGGYAWEFNFPGIKDLFNSISFLVYIDDEIAGTIKFELNRQTLVATMMRALLPEFRRKGIGRDIAIQGMRYVFYSLGFLKVETGVHAENKASVQSNDHLMAMREGVLRNHMATERPHEYADRYLYGIIREEFEEKYGKLEKE